jgi:hypothetical protein
VLTTLVKGPTVAQEVDSGRCTPSPQVRPYKADFATALAIQASGRAPVRSRPAKTCRKNPVTRRSTTAVGRDNVLDTLRPCPRELPPGVRDRRHGRDPCQWWTSAR